MGDPKTLHPSPKLVKKPPLTVEVPGAPEVKGETKPRRNFKTKDALELRPEESIRTIYDILRRSSEKFGNAKALGSRRVIKVHKETEKIKRMVGGQEREEEKKWSYFELSGYNYMSFTEYEKLALQAGAGLRDLGIKAEDRLHIFAATSPYWLGMVHGTNTCVSFHGHVSSLTPC